MLFLLLITVILQDNFMRKTVKKNYWVHFLSENAKIPLATVDATDPHTRSENAKILLATVVATDPGDTVANEFVVLLLSDSGLQVENVLEDATEPWTAAMVLSDDDDAEHTTLRCSLTISCLVQIQPRLCLLGSLDTGNSKEKNVIKLHSIFS